MGNTPQHPTTMSQEDEQTTFDLFDKVGDGKISVADVGAVLRALGHNPTETDMTKITKDFDPENKDTKRVSFQEFAPLLKQTSAPATSLTTSRHSTSSIRKTMVLSLLRSYATCLEILVTNLPIRSWMLS